MTAGRSEAARNSVQKAKRIQCTISILDRSLKQLQNLWRRQLMTAGRSEAARNSVQKAKRIQRTITTLGRNNRHSQLGQRKRRRRVSTPDQRLKQLRNFWRRLLMTAGRFQAARSRTAMTTIHHLSLNLRLRLP